MLTDEEIKKVLLYSEFSVRKRKRTLEELQPTYASVLRRKLCELLKIGVHKAFQQEYGTMLKAIRILY